jgi:hypothetical protein
VVGKLASAIFELYTDVITLFGEKFKRIAFEAFARFDRFFGASVEGYVFEAFIFGNSFDTVIEAVARIPRISGAYYTPFGHNTVFAGYASVCIGAVDNIGKKQGVIVFPAVRYLEKSTAFLFLLGVGGEKQLICARAECV